MITTVAAEELVSWAGKDLGTGAWFTVDQALINQFADLTLDHQFIHVDEELAAQTPFGGTIAHGFLTLSLLTHLTAELKVLPANMVMGINYGFDKVRFLNPVRAGKRVRARVRLADVSEKDRGRFLVKQEISVEIEGEKVPALACEWLAMFVCQ